MAPRSLTPRGVPSSESAEDHFDAAIASMLAAPLRPEVVAEPMKPPQRLAPRTYALALDVMVDGLTLATGRLVVLHDPAGHDSWDGTYRLVGYASAEADPEMGRDPMLAEVGWSWLLDGLAGRGAAHSAAGGTVTQTSSTRFGDLAGPPTTLDLELRASWTPLGDPPLDLSAHVLAWADLLCAAAGLPPEGAVALRR